MNVQNVFVQRLKFLIFTSLTVLFLAGIAIIKAPSPLKVIAPHLSIQSLEFGKFPHVRSPDQVGVEKAKFIPTSTVRGRVVWKVDRC